MMYALSADWGKGNQPASFGKNQRMNYSITTIEHLHKVISRSGGPDAVLLLGAGASLKSGIPLSASLVERAAKWAYCRSFGRHPDDPSVVRSDWLPWLFNHPWYRRDQPPADNYSAVIEHLLQPREDRKEFLLRISNPGVSASAGYERLIEFMSQHQIRSVLTTNFDAVLSDLCRERHRPHHVEVIKTPADFTKFSTSPLYPQLIYLHGSIEHYTDKNLLHEVQRLDEQLVNQLFPLLRDHPLVVIGYRGSEPSIMRHLIMDQADLANRFRHGIFWCARPGSIPDGLHPFVRELADTIGGNLQVVPIEGFDELMEHLWSLNQWQSGVSPEDRTSGQEPGPSYAPTFDMTHITESSLEDVDWSRVQTCLVAYCRRMAVPVPVPVTREWLELRLYEYDLARNVKGQPHLTVAGYLLFARRFADRLRSAHIRLRLWGEPERTFEGHLWNQLETLMDALEEVNRPFRLKGSISEVVYPYPPLALKELVVNALVHRSYQESPQVVIEVEPMAIRIINPGGLVEEVRQRVARPLQEEIEQGKRGIKGYRNPVIADIFYGAGAMDKAGSGLADVQRWVMENQGKVIFGPNSENTAFQVTLYRRPESVDSITGVATPLVTKTRYISNLLEIVELPRVVWHASTSARKSADIWQSTHAEHLPAFMLSETRLFTFADLRDSSNLLRGQIDLSDVRELPLADFVAGAEGERRLVRLFNQCLYQHLEGCGLYLDKKRQRAYFPRTDEGPREITYHARLRRATRTVTKPVISKTTQKVRYWEHEAIRFGFERYGDAWALQILPGYVFTINGFRRLVEGPKVGPLATRRAARDYNPQVYNDLVFWTWVLANGAESILLNTGDKQIIELRAQLAAGEVQDIVPRPEVVESDIEALPELSNLEEELAELIETAYGEGNTETDVDHD